ARRGAAPPSRITHGSPLRSAVAAGPPASPGTPHGARTRRAAAGSAGAGPGSAAAGSAGSDQDTSAGRMSVASPPGGPRAAATPSAASAATSALRADRRTPTDTEPG